MREMCLFPKLFISFLHYHYLPSQVHLRELLVILGNLLIRCHAQSETMRIDATLTSVCKATFRRCLALPSIKPGKGGNS